MNRFRVTRSEEKRKIEKSIFSISVVHVRHYIKKKTIYNNIDIFNIVYLYGLSQGTLGNRDTYRHTIIRWL